MEHQNIVPFVGVTIDALQIISEWMPGGDLRTYINSYPHTDRVALVSVLLYLCDLPPHFYQLVDVANGLNYLHSCGVIHGDIKGVSTR